MPSRSSRSRMSRHGGGALVAVDGDAHDLRAGAMQRRDLRDRLVDIGGVGVGHRLHDDRRAAADDHAADVDADRCAARERRGKISGHGRPPFVSGATCVRLDAKRTLQYLRSARRAGRKPSPVLERAFQTPG